MYILLKREASADPSPNTTCKYRKYIYNPPINGFLCKPWDNIYNGTHLLYTHSTLPAHALTVYTNHKSLKAVLSHKRKVFGENLNLNIKTYYHLHVHVHVAQNHLNSSPSTIQNLPYMYILTNQQTEYMIDPLSPPQ